jgi:hypothetical protein
MHEYGAAVDIDSKKDGFSNDKFYIALGEHSQRLGLTWGGTFSADRRHVQAVSIKDQPVLRSLLPNELDKFVQQRLAGGVRATL